jgi:hypothetical protein
MMDQQTDMSDVQQTELEIRESQRIAEHRSAQQQSNNNNQSVPSLAEMEPEVIVIRHNDAADVAKLCDILAKRFILRMFAIESRLHILDDNGALIPVSTHLMRTILAATFAVPELILRNSHWEATTRPLEGLENQTIVDILSSTTLKVAKASHQLQQQKSPQICSEIVFRIRQGEARSALAKQYFGEASSATLAEISRIEQAAGPRW